MSEHRRDVPQEWPEHLRSAAVVSAVNTVSPVGAPLLDFSAMPSATFEQFCWWLLKKDQTLVGCKRLGGNGTAQWGIDLFAFDEQQSSKLSVFECKAWEDFKSTNLTQAVDAFLGGPWAASTKTFTIILAQEDIGGALALRWTVEKERLKKAGVDGDLWTAHNLTLRVQTYPDILSKFFPWPSVAFFANQWMERVAFYELVSKAFFDPRERVADWARIPYSEPQAPSGMNVFNAYINYTCICRANKDGRSADNCSKDNKEFAMGYGEGATLMEAKRAAEKDAKEKLGAKSTHHVQCRCRTPTGEQKIPTR